MFSAVRLAIVSLALLINPLFVACNRTAPGDEQAIVTLLTERRQALVNRDFSRYRPLISPAYQDKGQDYNRKTAELAATLAGWDTIDYQADPPTIEVAGNRATTVTRYRLRVARQGKVVEFAGEEVLKLVREKGTWKISGGL